MTNTMTISEVFTLDGRQYQDVNDKRYQIVDGLYFNPATPERVCYQIASAYRRGERVRLWYGDTTTGRAWGEEYDIIGSIGRSCGPVKAPLLITNSRSHGGPAILDHCIVAITTAQGGRGLYTHPTFSKPLYTAEAETVKADGKLYARCGSCTQAQRLADFMNGRRNSK